MPILSIFRHNQKVPIVKYYTAQVCLAQGIAVPSINNGKAKVFINPIGNEHISWTTFLNLFTLTQCLSIDYNIVQRIKLITSVSKKFVVNTVVYYTANIYDQITMEL